MNSEESSAKTTTVLAIFERLQAAFGPQHWWPAKTPTEVVLGAILTQNTAWKNVVRAIANLRRADCLCWNALRDLPNDRLAELIRPSGTYRVKAARVRAFVDHLWRHHDGSLSEMLTGDLEDVRRRLLSIHGVGPETADAILLYAGGRATFVVDAYTHRILRRHRMIAPNFTYEQVRQLFHGALPADPTLFNEYHALLVAVGKNYCRPTARCDECPLASMPHDSTL